MTMIIIIVIVIIITIDFMDMPDIYILLIFFQL